MAKTKQRAKSASNAKPKVVKKPTRPTKPSLPLPPPPPAPPPLRDELAAPRDVGRLLHYGERFGAKKIDVRMLPMQLKVTSGELGLADASATKTWKVLDRPASPGSFGVMVSIAKAEGAPDRLAAVVLHVGRPPIARWSAAHCKGARVPKSVDQIPRWTITSGWIVIADGGRAPGAIATPATAPPNMPVVIPFVDGGNALAVPSGNGEFAAYWAIDAHDKPVCLVIDFEAFTQKEWKAKA